MSRGLEKWQETVLTFFFFCTLPTNDTKQTSQLALHPRDVRPPARAPRPGPLRHGEPPELGSQGERAAAQRRRRRREQKGGEEALEGRADLLRRRGTRRVRGSSEEGLVLFGGGLERE